MEKYKISNILTAVLIILANSCSQPYDALTTTTAPNAFCTSAQLGDTAYIRTLDTFYASGQEKYLDGQEGIPIYTLTFLQDSIEKGAIMISSGRTEAAFKYREVIYELYHIGYSVYILDHRGQGFSGRMADDPHMGYVEDFQFYVDDMKAFYKQAILKAKHEKIFLLAHSMGGTIGMAYLEQYPSDFDAAAFSSPMLGLSAYICPLAKLFSGKTVKYAPGQGGYSEDSSSYSGNDVSGSAIRFQMKIRDLEKQPRAQLGGSTIQWVEESCRQIKSIHRKVENIETPFIIFSGELEAVVHPKGSEKLVRKARKLDKKCKLFLLEDAKHEILMERDPIRSVMLQTTLDFFDGQLHAE